MELNLPVASSFAAEKQAELQIFLYMSPWQDHKLLKACGFRRLACLVIIASRLHGVGDKQGSGADTGLHYPGLLSSGAVDALDNLDVARDVMQASNPSSMSTPPESVAVVWS